MPILINCPFCGGPSELYVTNHIPKGYDYTPRCKDTSCCGRLTKKFHNREEAIFKWNKAILVDFDPEQKQIFTTMMEVM